MEGDGLLGYMPMMCEGLAVARAVVRVGGSQDAGAATWSDAGTLCSEGHGVWWWSGVVGGLEGTGRVLAAIPLG